MSRQYIAAGRIVDEVLNGRRSFKSVAHSNAGSSVEPQSTGKVEYLLAAQTLKYKSALLSLVEKVAGSDLDEGLFKEIQKGVFLVMVYELLFSGHKSIHGGGRVKKLIMEKFAESLQAQLSQKEGLADLDAINGMPTSSSIASSPQYIRINQVKMSVEEGLEYVASKFSHENFSNDVRVGLDDIIPALIKISTTLGNKNGKARLVGDDPLVVDGRLIIQDKASCFSAQVLFNCWKHVNLTESVVSRPIRLHILDACAAPGNKTTHLAALFSALPAALLTYRISAIEKDLTRSRVLQGRVVQAGVQGQVSVAVKDFLQLDDSDSKYGDVSAILLDPSCSGSGMKDRSLDRKLEDDEAMLHRLEKLRRFQVQCVLKAMCFGQTNLIVYSTCSIHWQENEAVVAEALCRQAEVSSGGWELMEPIGFEKWKRRGDSLPENTTVITGRSWDDSCNTTTSGAVVTLTLSDWERQCLLRCLPEDETNGFFVAVFRRASNKNLDSEEKMRSKKRKNIAYDGGGPNLRSDKADEAAAVGIVPGQSKKKGKITVAKESKEVKPDHQGRSLFEGKKFRVRAFSKAKIANRKRL
eukprot:gene33919-43821_t